jgi:hypothetical protein
MTVVGGRSNSQASDSLVLARIVPEKVLQLLITIISIGCCSTCLPFKWNYETRSLEPGPTFLAFLWKFNVFANLILRTLTALILTANILTRHLSVSEIVLGVFVISILAITLAVQGTALRRKDELAIFFNQVLRFNERMGES